MPGGHDDPAADDAAETISSLSPVSGSFTVTENVTSTVAPTARSPLHVSTPPAKDTDPALANAFPSYTASSANAASESVTVIPAYGVCPELVIASVKPTADPGTGVVVLGVLPIVRPGVSTSTVAEHAGSPLPAGQLLPGADVLSTLVITWLPVSGLSTVTVPVTVTVPPTGMLPVQLIPVGVTVSVPDVAVWSPFGVALSSTLTASLTTVIPVYGVCPVLVIVAVNRTTLPGVAVATLATYAIDRDDTATVEEQAGAVPPAGQLLPAAAEVTALDRMWFAGIGVVHRDRIGDRRGSPLASGPPSRSRLGLANDTVPTLAAALAL